MNQVQPPRFWIWFIQWYCRPALQETILGDLEEEFAEDVERLGPARARLRFAWNALRFFRPGITRKLSGTQKLNTYGMIKHDFKTTLRIAVREKLYTLINVSGLTAGISIALLIFTYVNFELGYESYNPNADRLARITIDYLDGETLIDQDCETYHPLGGMMKADFPEVEEFARAYRVGPSVVKVDEQQFRPNHIYAVDPSFNTLFHYPLIMGNAETALRNPLEVVLTESEAMKYFGTIDVVGRTIWVAFTKRDMKIVGVCADSPADTHFKIEMLMSYATMKDTFDKRESQWNSNDAFTYVLLTDGDQFSNFEASLERLTAKLVAEDKIDSERVIGQMAKDVHLYSHKTYEAEPNGNANIVFFLLGVGILVIVIAIVNYINLATAKSLDRAKEVGIRKVIGSSNTQLRLRFMIESFVINCISGLMALLLISVLWPKFVQVAGLPATLSPWTNQAFWLVFGLLLLCSTLLAGIFPASVVAAFKPITVLKGKFTNSSKGVWLRKSLVVFQFAIATFLLIQTLTSTQQLSYMQAKDLGLEAERMVVVSAPATGEEMKSFATFRDALANKAFVQAVSLSACYPGLPTSTMGSTTGRNLTGAEEEHNFNFFLYHIDHHYLPAMEIELLAGENFRENDKRDGIIVNEESIRLWGISSPEEAINKTVEFGDNHRPILGVVKNFHQTGVKSDYVPLMLNYGGTWGDYVSIRVNPGDVAEQLEEIEALYEAHFDSPFEFTFLDQTFDNHFKSDQQFQTVFSILSLFALLITCLGIFGLASFTVAKRQKEIGIRKVLGAAAHQIIALISKEFLALIVIATLLSVPLTYFIVEQWLLTYTYHIDLSLWLFVVPVALVLLVAFLTVLSRTIKVSNTNPVTVLRYE